MNDEVSTRLGICFLFYNINATIMMHRKKFDQENERTGSGRMLQCLLRCENPGLLPPSGPEFSNKKFLHVSRNRMVHGIGHRRHSISAFSDSTWHGIPAPSLLRAFTYAFCLFFACFTVLRVTVRTKRYGSDCICYFKSTSVITCLPRFKFNHSRIIVTRIIWLN